MKYLTEVMDFDMVYLIVSPKNPLKDNIGAESGKERYNAAVEAIGRHKGLKVKADDIELHMPSPQYTIRTLDALRKREPQNEFTLVIGADNLAGIRKWRDYRRILNEYGVAVYPRKGHDINALKKDLIKEDHGFRITCMDAPSVDISSTEIRDGIAAGHDMSAYMM